jgi:hypothetical protein|tara:strand:+ start:306 stop:668 length:363 start_codon:yes stop_codon:yes gene_type:complete
MRPKDKEDEIREQHQIFLKQEIEGQKIISTTNKINNICEALKDEFLKRNEDSFYLLPILTVYVKKQPQELKQVLELIRVMQQEEKNLNQTSRVVPPHLNPVTLKKDIDPKSLKQGAKDAL